MATSEGRTQLRKCGWNGGREGAQDPGSRNSHGVTFNNKPRIVLDLLNTARMIVNSFASFNGTPYYGNSPGEQLRYNVHASTVQAFCSQRIVA